MDKKHESLQPVDMKKLLEMAQADRAAWNEAQVWTLENYLVKIGRERLPVSQREEFGKKISAADTLEELIALGNEYKLLADYDLQTESLPVYARQKGLIIN